MNLEDDLIIFLLFVINLKKWYNLIGINDFLIILNNF